MITIFVKFTNHADELLNGHIRMNPLEYYRGVEKILSGNTSELDNPAVYDVLEGSAGYIPIDDCVKFGIHFSDEEKEHFRGMHLLDETAKYLKLFCLYQWHFFPEKGTAVRLPNELNQFGKDAVIIKNKKTLLDRMLGSIRALENFHTAFADSVEYYDSERDFTELGGYPPWNKRKEYAWQKEFRVGILEKSPCIEWIDLEIGPISDIAFKVNSQSLILHPEWYVPKYKFE